MLFKALRVGGLTQVAPEAGSRREKVQGWVGGGGDTVICRDMVLARRLSI